MPTLSREKAEDRLATDERDMIGTRTYANIKNHA